MYRIYADDTLIYDSTLEDYKIAEGEITLEADTSGSFVFSIYPDHPYYDRFVRMRTVITVYKSGRIVFRGRILSDTTDYHNCKVITCEGELGFLLDSIVRPYEFTGSHVDLFAQFIEDHNRQVDEFKRFKVGTVTVVDENNYINRSSSGYATTMATMETVLTGSALGGHFFITHGDDGTDPIPTIHYLADFTHTATQTIEFGKNLRDYVKTVQTDELATAIIPLGVVAEDVVTEETSGRVTIEDVNNCLDYVYSEAGVALYGWIFKTIVWDDVTLANNLKRKAEEYLEHIVNQNITVTLNAIDLHLLDQTIESFRVCDSVHVKSEPHNLDAVLLCHQQTLDLLHPENDTVVLGYKAATFTGNFNDVSLVVAEKANEMSAIKQEAKSIKMTVEKLDENISSVIEQTVRDINLEISDLANDVNAKLELKVSKEENDQVVSMLNASADVVEFKSNRLSIDSDNFKLTADGELVARKATIQNEGSEYSAVISDGMIHVTGPTTPITAGVKYRILTFEIRDDANTFYSKCGLFVTGTVRDIGIGANTVYQFVPVAVTASLIEEE